MAQNKTSTQAQLSFPELAEPEVVRRPQDGSHEAFVSQADVTADDAEEIARVTKPTRKRAAKPRIALVTNASEENPISHSDLVAETPEVGGSKTESSQEFQVVSADAAPGLSEALEVKPVVQTAAEAQAPSKRTELGRFALKSIALLSSMVAAVVVAGAVLWVGHEVVETQRVQRETLALQSLSLRQSHEAAQAERNSRAVELFMRYNELQLAASFPKGAKREARYAKESLALSLLESLSNLTRGHSEWDNTVQISLERHLRFIREQRVSCASYSPEFIRVMEKATGSKASTFCRGATAAE